MKFEVMQELLVKGLTMVSKAVSSRPQLPVLSNILIEAKTDGIYLSATDLELGIKTKILGKIEKVGKITVPSRMVVDFVGSLPTGKVSFELERDTLVVKSGSYSSKIQTISAEEFPDFPEVVKENSHLIDKKTLSEGADSVLYSTAKDSLRPVLTGVLFEFGKKSMKLVATDGFRLGVTKVSTKGGGEEGSYLIPARAILEVSKMESEGDVLFSALPGNQVAFMAGETVITSQLIDGNYPEYQKIVPSEFETEVLVSREDLLQAVKVVHIFARDNSNMVKWEVDSSGISMSAESPERGEAESQAQATVTGDGGEIVFNAKFVLDFLQSSKAEEIWFGMSGSLAPGAFREKGNEDRLYVVMPINA